jgi:hypothetical protein
MIYDEPSRSLKPRELARLSFRRTMELGIAASLAGGIGGAVVSVDTATRAQAPWLLGIPILLGLVLASFFFLRRQSPADAALERFARDIRAKRKAGRRPAALSRTFVTVVALVACLFAIIVARRL